MASTSSIPNSDPSLSSDDTAAKLANKRYDGLLTVRTKAVKGKGAWYWAHLEPILIRNPDTNLPRAVKLKCSLCAAVFSASNPSRTASEHLKRGTCSNFTSVLTPNSSPSPISSLPSQKHQKRKSVVNPLAMVESAQNVVSGANNARLNQVEALSLSMLENSVKKIKSLKNLIRPELSNEQSDSALELLADWFFESCGSVSFSSIEHPKFQAFLNHVGLPAVLKKEFSSARLDCKFDEAKTDSEARIKDVMFFQVASDGWNLSDWCCGDSGGADPIKFVINLPNGRSVFQKVVYTGGSVSSKYAEEIMWEAATGVCGGVLQRCVGIVADKYKAKALRNLEIRNQWMVNLSCQLQGFLSLIKDFNKEHPLFRRVTENCLKLANFVNTKSEIRSSFKKYMMQGFEYVGYIRVPSPKCDASSKFALVYAMLEDIFNCWQVLQMVVLDDSCKAVCVEDSVAREVAWMVKSEIFWSELEAVYSLVNIIKEMAQEIEVERPLIGECLPLWEALRRKVKEWCAKFSIAEGPVDEIVERRFIKNYHPAWSAAFILDPLYLMRDTSGKYLPPFKCLTRDQEKDVDKLITRLVLKEEAHIALMELMKWRSEGLDPLYAQAVQVKQKDPVTGKLRIANPQSSRLVWETCLREFKSLGKVAVRLIFLHATSCVLKSNWSLMRWFGVHKRSREGLDRAQRMIFIAAHSKLERQDFSSDEENDANLFAVAGKDDMLNEVFVDAPSV